MVNSLLGVAVVTQALSDLVNPRAYEDGGDKDKKERKRLAVMADAKEFLFSEEREEDLKMWCQFANLNFHWVRSRAHYILDNNVDVWEETERLRKEMKDEPAPEPEPDDDALSGGLPTSEQLDGIEQEQKD